MDTSRLYTPLLCLLFAADWGLQTVKTTEVSRRFRWGQNIGKLRRLGEIASWRDHARPRPTLAAMLNPSVRDYCKPAEFLVNRAIRL